MAFTMNLIGQVNQMRLPKSKALWPLFETIVNAIQSIEDTPECTSPQIVILANRDDYGQLDINGEEEQCHFKGFVVTDNGAGFTEKNYHSFLEAYSTLKIKKGCKGIGRFLWLKAFECVEVESVYQEENGEWFKREFTFTLSAEVSPAEENTKKISDFEDKTRHTTIRLIGFKNLYKEEVAKSLESLAKKIIEHCLPYFISGGCPQIVLRDNLNGKYDLKEYFDRVYKDSLQRDEMQVKGQRLSLYHMMVREGADKHELHLCANSREVTSYDLSKEIPNLQKKIDSEEGTYYYVGYVAGEYLDNAVSSERYEFDFSESNLMGTANERDVVEVALEFISAYLGKDLAKISESKKEQIDNFVRYKKPQYRYLLNSRENIYDEIPVGLPEDKLDLELYKHEQRWEYEIKQKAKQIEQKHKSDMCSADDFMSLFKDYCSSVTALSQASLAEYVARRKAVIDLLEKALESDENGKYSREAAIHSIICPMRITSDDVSFDEMNLWLIDDRLSYHHFLASDQPMKSLPVLENDVAKRMDIAIFDRAMSYAQDINSINSITIIELKRPQRDDLDVNDKNPISQVLGYVGDIKSGKVKKANGRDFGNVNNVAFYCYVIADLTDSLKNDATYASLLPTPDGEGFFGYNMPVGAYVEVISYDKLLKNAKQRNGVLFDKLFRPKSGEILVLDKQD